MAVWDHHSWLLQHLQLFKTFKRFYWLYNITKQKNYSLHIKTSARIQNPLWDWEGIFVCPAEWKNSKLLERSPKTLQIWRWANHDRTVSFVWSTSLKKELDMHSLQREDEIENENMVRYSSRSSKLVACVVNYKTPLKLHNVINFASAH